MEPAYTMKEKKESAIHPSPKGLGFLASMDKTGKSHFFLSKAPYRFFSTFWIHFDYPFFTFK